MKETSSSRARLGCRLVFDALFLSGFPLLCYLIVPNQNNCNNCLSEEIKLKALKSSMETALHGAHIRECRKVTAAVPRSGEPRAGQAGRSWQLKGGRSVAESLDAALRAALLQRAVVQ